MNAKQLRKEVRPLIWPWCAVVLTGLSPLIFMRFPWSSDFSQAIWMLGWFVGLPLLATLPLGMEFQNHTISLLLSQPIDRRKIWAVKICLAALIAVSAAQVFVLVNHHLSLLPDGSVLSFLEPCLLAMVAAAVYWTLFARSTVGGVILNLASVLVTAVVLNQLFSISVFAMTERNMERAWFIFLGCYGALMLWLGRRRLHRFEVAGNNAGSHFMASDRQFLPTTLAWLFRCRPRGAVLNLVRKEFRLLRPIWFFVFLSSAPWPLFSLLRFLHFPQSVGNLKYAAIVVACISIAMSVVLAGSLGLGEDRSMGTRAWHMTLPISAKLQWSIKLGVALLAGVTGGWLIPYLVSQRVFGWPQLNVDRDIKWVWLIAVVLLTLVAFWCESAVDSTVAAVIWVSPVFVTLGVAWGLGGMAALKSTKYLTTALHTFASVRSVEGFASNFSAAAGEALWFDRAANSQLPMSALLILPLVLFGAYQSYRQFRWPAQSGRQPLVHTLLPLMAVVFLYSGCWTSMFAFRKLAMEEHWDLMALLSHSVQDAADVGALDPAPRPFQLVGFAPKVGGRPHLPESWVEDFRGSTLTMVPMNPVPTSPEYFQRNGTYLKDARAWRVATVSLPHAFDCTESFGHWNVKTSTYTLIVFCK